MSAAEWVSAAGNVIMAAAAVGGAIAAFRGLSTWKNQNQWQQDVDLSRSVLLRLYHFRDAVYGVRNPFMSNEEMRIEGEPADIPNREAHRMGVISAYQKRLERQLSARRELDALLIESDALWGPELRRLCLPMFKLAHELGVYVSLHLDANFRGEEDDRFAYREILQRRRNVLYDINDEEDAFRKDFTVALKPAEDYLRMKLGRHTP